MSERRRDHEQPVAVAMLGWRYHHVGILCTPPHPQEKHLDHLGVHVRGFEISPFGIDWMRFEPYCCVPETVRTVPRAGWNPHMSAFRFDCVCLRTRTETR